MPRKSKPSPKLWLSSCLEEISPYEFEGDITAVQSRLNDWIVKYGPTVKLSWDPDNWEPYAESPSPIYRIMHDREETDEEFAKRLDTIAENEAKTLAHDLAEFERLKVKLTGKK